MVGQNGWSWNLSDLTMVGHEFIRIKRNIAESAPNANLSVTFDFSFAGISTRNLFLGKFLQYLWTISLLCGWWSQTRLGLNPNFKPQ